MGIFDFLSKALGPKTDIPLVPKMPDPVQTVARPVKTLFPARPANALGARAFLSELGSVDPTVRDAKIRDQIISGNVPSWMKPVSLTIQQGAHTLIVQVLPDYLCFGSDTDFLTYNVNHTNLQAICERFSCVMPTRSMVNQYYKQAVTRLTPQPQGAPYDSTMSNTDRMVRFNSTIEVAKHNAGHSNGYLIAGHKKDVVMSAQAIAHPGMESIYGWHQPSGVPIQPLSYAHERGYSDYSHGGRLTLRRVNLNGVDMDISTVLSDPASCGLLSDEGPLHI